MMNNNISNKLRVLGIVAACMLAAACSQDNEQFGSSPATGILRFDITDAIASNGGARRAATDGATMTTTFEVGDAAGLYIVKDGTVKYDNLKLTMNDMNVWEPATTIQVSDELAGARYYIYYPYSVDAEFDVTATEPLKAYADAIEIPADQSSQEAYETADVMVGSTTTVADNNTVSVQLKHQKALVCMELPNTSYSFSNAGMTPYVLAKAENAVFTLGNELIEPYKDAATQTYRYLVNAGQTDVLTVTFTDNGAEKSYSVTNLSQIPAGQYAEYVIDGGVQSTDFGTLEVGDWYCADGTLVKGSSAAPSNAIGIVFKTGTTDNIAAANSNWTHGVVLALGETKSKWGADGSTTSAQNNAGWKYWYRSYGLNDQNGKTNAAQLDEGLMVEDGYENTVAWRAVPEPLTIGEYTLDYTTVMNSVLDNWTDSNELPAGINTGWYIPSLVDWQHIDAQASVLTTQLTSAGGTALSADPYWSSNVRAAGSNWCYVLNKTTLADRYKGVACKDSRLFRFIFAF